MSFRMLSCFESLETSGHVSKIPGQKSFFRIKAFLVHHLSSQSCILTLPLSTASWLCWKRQILFAWLFICHRAWRGNNYLSVWSITWLLTTDTQDVWRGEPRFVLEDWGLLIPACSVLYWKNIKTWILRRMRRCELANIFLTYQQ